MKCWTILATLVLVSSAQANLRPLFDAIREVESGGNPDAVGDGGRSIGPYQIQWAYWKDSGVPGKYHQVRDHRYAERVMIAYWKRYCPQALARRDYQTLARVHNGGLTGHRKAATLPYWHKVARELRARKAVSSR
ncbi:MAG TPA: hypothetical protein PKG54_17710 [Phycisphaerae bacterium]|jgi:hypothetical protein|nr:hypothetical protein [Phycisphaerae bacterium]HOB76351.1 hypothetical protein [Phycisphaerae bacterium]HOJ55401.1 hypothetical protein [Phycisphaerae bacterium]HOL24949.1 hypothetical protein [Phycisphaerae bacterium]HPP20051.1 hypothetical protein [Phycisphaerae bacterium]